MIEGDACVSCGRELEPRDFNLFIIEIERDLLWHCSCGQRYDVDHECYPNFCSEYLEPIYE